MKRVYVAGAYSGDNILTCLQNIGKGEALASEVFMLGHAPFCPWHDKSYIISNPHIDFMVNDFYEYTLKWLEVSDCILLVKDNWEHSKGTLAEIELAKKQNIPIFDDISIMLEWAKENTNG